MLSVRAYIHSFFCCLQIFVLPLPYPSQDVLVQIESTINVFIEHDTFWASRDLGAACPRLIRARTERNFKIKSAAMFTLLRGLWNYFFKKEEYYIVILGLDNAGKTVWAAKQATHESRYLCKLYAFWQTLLEKTKNLFIRNYNGVSMEKITSTVGLNGKECSHIYCHSLSWALSEGVRLRYSCKAWITA